MQAIPPMDAQELRQHLTDLTSQPKDEAYSMPSPFYTSQEFLDLEKEQIFRNEWVCVGHVGEVAEPGDFYTTELVDEQLLVVRNDEGGINVLSNVCRHRGNMVENEASGNRRSFVCPYHAWTYKRDGALKTAPLMRKAKAFDAKKCSLPQFKTEIWNNFIFVNLDGKAKPLAPQLASLDGILHNYHHELRNLLFKTEDVWATNWKNLTENFMEGYHLFATHPKTLQPMTPTQLCRKVPSEDRWTAYRSYYDPEYPPRGPFHDDMTEDEQRNSVLFNIFPSFVVAVAANYTLFLCLRPNGADKVSIRWGVCGLKTDPTDPEVVAYVDLCKAFNAEDKEKLETLQQAQKTRFFAGGPLAPDDLEGTIWDFLSYMDSKLGVKPVATAAE
ncbi:MULTISPECIES: aromatic ring-hydroxylating oxygenase subunit alpha [Pacificibacter]|uniref:aromatic ring-hydroxylating oxygenase subunit alpha n=1 Tax=Pacificibacter TaxID=1042323 RepID=UPI001C09679F|nr:MULTISPECIES: aromatic ring-hydroxylating dioxygenase subunit alpha [Pacificibacter]MBU2936450.1 aromatic ring-hydroxylating dioxygenase subunit alpha [Pacificibacter marinus]MDO6616580.1 aromatic ring-hydroxylating dioxygenase subunit alpha [Pacificibacter sp. 1_MG-2023]